MKRLLLLMAIYMVAATGLSLRAENFPKLNTTDIQDTITIKLSNGAGMKIFVKSTRELKSLQNYKLDSLMAMLSDYVEKAETMEKTNSKEGKKELTMTFYPAKDSKDTTNPEQVTVTISAAGTQTKDEKGNVITGIANVIVKYSEKNDKHKDKDDHLDADHDDDDENDNNDKNKNEKRNTRAKFSSSIDLGLNAFAKYPTGSDLYDLKPLGSRYVSLNQHLNVKLAGPLHLTTGFELAFNNYMLDKNRYVTDANGITVFNVEQNRSFEKSKLTTSSINVPLMFKLKFRENNGKDGFVISAGGFAGYRLGSHTKLKYQEEGRTIKDKERGSYNLEDFQYGVNFSLGYRDVEIFGKYNLNELFKESRGPQINVVSFGIRI